MVVKNRRLQRSRLSAALVAAMLVPVATGAYAQETDSQEESQPQASQQATNLDKVVVTGSLIPQTEIETFKPVTVITAEDIAARGLVDVTEVLSQSTYSTGGVQGSQSSASFTQGAETISMFGLDPGYTKYLINGRPMANYPALYNGSDTFNNISGIPVGLVERIEILPGGQSSLYGSDAIAGVVNIILKKRITETSVSVRGGTFTEGGGDSGRITAETGFSAIDDRLSVSLGAQYENREPIWGYQRDITSQFYTNGSSPPLASRDYLVYGYQGIADFGFSNFGYQFRDPNDCANVTGQFDGTEGKQFRPGSGDYCGSFYTPGYRTLRNGKDSFQFYGRATFDINDNHQFYADALYNNEEVDYHIGSNYTWWGTGVKWGYYYDPDTDSFLNLQRAFSPEDMGPGGFGNTMAHDKNEAIQANLGFSGMLGNWDYDAGVTLTRYDLDEQSFARFADPINDYFENTVLGPQLGLDPYFGVYPMFRPDYAAFYQPMSPEDFYSFTGYINSKAKTSDDMLRVQFTNASLFQLPGGDAGIALAAEYSQEDWRYTPDPRLMNGEIWGQTSVDGGGERDRYAVIAETRLPVLDPLTISISGRYDSFSPDGAEKVDKPTYSLGLEYRPVDSLLFRGKYGTAFKAPTLADQFQAESGFYSFVTDYYSCQQLGFGPDDIDNCPAAFSSRQYFGTTAGSADLDPLKADVWNAGVVWAPTDYLSFSADYFDWDIRDEVATQNADGLALREMYCRTGEPGYDINSPLCQDALSKITRNSTGQITQIFTPKVNEAQELLSAVVLSANYTLRTNGMGEFVFRGNYTNILDHEFLQFEGDDPIDLLRRPGWESDPKVTADASVTWRPNDRFSTTLYANYMGHTPNYRARVLDSYDDEDAGKLDAYYTFNASFTYRPLPPLALSLSVNNLLNEMPPEDNTYPGSSGSPYNSSQYSAYGRAIYLEGRYTFGR